MVRLSGFYLYERAGADGFFAGLKFDNTYAWVTRWNKDGKIVQVRAYLDSALVKQAIEENE